MAADHLKILNRAVLGNHGRQMHHTRNARLLGERRVDRLGLADQLGLLDVAADRDAFGGNRLFDLDGGRRRWRRCRSGDRPDDAAEHAAGSTTGHAAWDATYYTTNAAGRRRKLFFLNGGDFL